MTRLEFDIAWWSKDKTVKVRMQTPKGEREEIGYVQEVNFNAYLVKVLIAKWNRTCYVGSENIRFV